MILFAADREMFDLLIRRGAKTPAELLYFTELYAGRVAIGRSTIELVLKWLDIKFLSSLASTKCRRRSTAPREYRTAWSTSRCSMLR